MTLEGKSILERIVGSSVEIGLKDFVIVTGYEPEAIPRVAGDGSAWGARIEYRHNDRWYDLANGYSILAARDCLEGNFLVLMSDHLLEQSIVRSVADHAPPDGGCVLGVDPGPWDEVDLDDATRVLSAPDGRILGMGKGIADWNAVDTGVFHATAGLLRALEENLREGRSSLTDANLRLAGEGLMIASEIPKGARWYDLDTPAMFDARAVGSREPAESLLRC